MYLSNKERGLFFPPILEGLNRAEMAQGPLGNAAVVELAGVAEGGGQFGGGPEVGAFEQVGDAAVEARDPAVGLGMARREQAVRDAEFRSERVEGVLRGLLTGGHAAGR